MKILFALTYYRPHVSGLTVLTQRLAEALAARGHEVTVLTSQHKPELAREETLDGVRVVRVPAAFRVSKGAVMPSYPARALSLLRAHDIAVVNLPATPMEAVVLPILASLRARAPLVVIHSCDVRLPGALLGRLLSEAVFLSNAAGVSLAQRVVALTDDYARHSRLLRRFSRKCENIMPAVRMEAPDAEEVAAFRRRHAPRGEALVGMAARFASEKGVEYLLEALPQVRASLGDVKILFTGDPRNVIGEEKYFERMRPALARAGDRVVFLGTLDWAQLPVFYAACDATVLPSTNSTEAFGLVQLESMLSGTPVVASDLPGVRVPVQTTGMGRLVPPRDSDALARAIIEVVRRRASYVRPRAEIERQFSFDAMVRSYEELFERLLREKRDEGRATSGG